MNAVAVWGRIDDVAEDVGRLRRRTEPDSWAAHLLDRIAGHLEDLDAMTALSAAELVQVGYSIDHALQAVDDHRASTRRLLGTVKA